MYFKSFADHLSETCNCWKGYKRKPGTAPCAEGSCIKEGKRGLWDNIHAKQKRIKAGSGEQMRKPGSEGAPTDAALKASQNEEVSLHEAIDPSEVAGNPKMYSADIAKKAYYHKNASDSDKQSLARHLDRYHGAKEWRKPVKEDVEAQFDLIEEMVMDLAEQHNLDPELIWEKFEDIDDVQLLEYAVDAKGHKSSTGGLTQKGRDAYNAKGANLKAPVTTPPSKLKAGSKSANRRKSFCARMGGMEGPMKKPNGKPTRKALALRKWNC